MNKEKSGKHIIDGVFVICLLLMFLISALTVIAIGANIYKKNVSAMSHNYNHRAACAYITEKVRQTDINGAIFVDNIFDQNTLVLQNEVNGVLYNTYIYDYNGYLMELYARADLENFYPQSGQKILEVNSFDISEVSDSLFFAELVVDGGEKESMYIAKRSTAEQ